MMINSRSLTLLAATAIALTIHSPKATADPMGTAFTYQGKLNDAGAPADGAYDLRFDLWNAQTGGTRIGTTIYKADVGVANGLFTIKLDFGSAFNGQARWLDIRVRPGAASGSYTALTPRQELTPPSRRSTATTPTSPRSQTQTGSNARTVRGQTGMAPTLG